MGPIGINEGLGHLAWDLIWAPAATWAHRPSGQGRGTQGGASRVR